MHKASNCDNEILSICIPTKDRTDKLMATLSEFLKQINILGLTQADIRIYISDNSENNLTETWIKRFFPDDKRIIYMKNESRVKNYPTNFMNLLANARGLYLWFFGDDDLPYDHALNEIFNQIYAYRFPDFIVAHYVGYDSLLKNRLPYWVDNNKGAHKILNHSFIDFLTSSYPYSGLISFIIMKKIHLENAIKNIIVDLESNYIQTFVWAIALLSMSEKQYGIELGLPIVKWREEFGNANKKDRRSKSRFLLGFEQREIFVALGREYGLPVLVKSYDGALQYKLIWGALEWRVKGHMSIDDAFVAAKKYTDLSLLTKMLFFLIGILPIFMLEVIKKIGKMARFTLLHNI